MKIRLKHGPQRVEPGLQLPRDFTGLLIATPAYGGMLTRGYTMSLMRTVVALAALRIPHELVIVENESLIPRARNWICAAFMAKPFSHLLCLDADVEWPREAPLRLLRHAVEHEIVMGCYPKKREPVDWPINWLKSSHERLSVGPTGCVEVESGPAGFLMIAKSAVSKMIAAHPELHYRTGCEFDEHQFALWDPFLEEDVYWSEDISFMLRWRRLGGSVWVDPSIKLIHHGTRAYTGSLMDAFRPIEAAEAAAGGAG